MQIDQKASEVVGNSCILVPCDFSPVSLAGLKFAAELSERWSLPLVCVSIIETNQQSIDNFKGEILRKQFDDFVTNLPKRLEISQLIDEGRFLPNFLRQIEKEKPCMVILGTSGSRGWDGSFMGSHAEKLVRTSPVPVLAVHAQTNVGGIHNIVMPFSTEFTPEDIMPFAQNLQKLFHAHLHLLHVRKGKTDSDGQLMTEWASYATRLCFRHCSLNIVYSSNEADGILRFASQVGADLIAMPTHGKKSLEKMYGPSIAADVVNHSRVATFTFSVEHLSDQNVCLLQGKLISVD